MGCSGSQPVAQPSEPLAAVMPSSSNNKLAAAGQTNKHAQQQQQQANGKAAPNGGDNAAASKGSSETKGIVRVKTLQKTGGGLAITTSESPAVSSPNSPALAASSSKPSTLPRKHSSAAATIPCDVDESHVATLRC